MKSINCDVIQDLLPSYVDKISSESTNKFVEEHLQSCKKCQDVLQSMGKEIDNKIIDNQDKQIDFLKGYRKDKKRSNIKAILIVVIVMILIFEISLQIFWNIFKHGININADDINVEYLYKTNNNELECYLYSEKYKYIKFCTQKIEIENEGGMKEIHLKIVGRDLFWGWSGTYETFRIDELTDKIYIEDKNGNLKEIWNKNTNVMTEEEWKHWYLNNYVPAEVKNEFGLNYDNLFVFRGR